MKRVFFDESGNTGQNLLDATDPVFVLSSCRFEPEQEAALLKHFAGRQGPELKFSRLRRNEAGQRAVVAFLQAAEVNHVSVASYIINKRFMIVTKYCDIVVEPTFREAGVDFYEKGLNIATANLLAMVMPTYLNPVTWDRFLAAFVRMIRERNLSAFQDFRRLAELAYNHLEHAEPEMASHIGASLLIDPAQLLPMLDDSTLDPLVPSYYFLAGRWGVRLGGPFELVVDKSKVLATQEGLLRKLSDPNLAPFRAGYDRRTMEFPLRVGDITAVDSRNQRQVQFADIVGGALARAANSSATRLEGSFENRIFKAFSSKELIVGGIWPSRDVDPVRLDTDEAPLPGQIALAEYTTMIARGVSRTRRIVPGN